MRTVPLTVLMHEGPIGRAYLNTMRRMGLRPATLVVMVYKRVPGTNKRAGGWLPGAMRTTYATALQDTRLNYWARRLAKTYAGFVRPVTKALTTAFDLPDGFYDELLRKWNYESYADRVRYVWVDGLGDNALSNTA